MVALNERGVAVRIEIVGVTASFRFPHFLIGRQPGFPMPPPATVYGLIAAALGDYPDPATIQFAYTFRCLGEATDDLEKIWFLTPVTSTRGALKDYNVEATSNVLPREILVQPRMTLYLLTDVPDQLTNAFRLPRFTLALGRSQDLISIRSISQAPLESANTGRLEPGLLPGRLRDRIHFGPTLTMPRFIDPENRSRIEWESYVALDRALRIGPGEAVERIEGEASFVDAERRDEDGRATLIVFHRFVAQAAASR